MVLKAISNTLRCQPTENFEKWTFRCHVRPNPAKVRRNVFVCYVHPPRTPQDLTNFNLNYEKTFFCVKLHFPSFTNRCLDVVSAQSSLTAARLVSIAPQGPWGLPCGSPILSVVALTVLVILMGVFPEPLET